MRKLLKKIFEILDGAPVAYGKKQSGQSLLETTMVIPILVIMIAGIVEIGWFAQNYLNLLEASKVGARRGPFLTDQNGVMGWDHNASLAPIAANTGKITDESYRYRNLDPATGKPYVDGGRCSGMMDTDFGFFNLITCTVLDAMDPLELSWTNGKDDIVVSAFSVQRVNVGSQSTHDIDLNNWAEGNSTSYPGGHQVIVVGRWPYNANECVIGGNAVERDPFDYITNGRVDWKYVPNPVTGGPNVRMVYEMAEWDESRQRYDDKFHDTGEERQRGFVWTGQHKIEGDSPGCYGSEWTSEEVQKLLNLPNFIGSDDAPLDGDVADWTQERLSHLPSQGVVLVEIFWQHTMLLGDSFPIWSPVYNILGGNDPESTADVIKVWAAFPAPSAEPSLLYKPPSPNR
jgi:hypothetical protein